jgi:hypothetical protein
MSPRLASAVAGVIAALACLGPSDAAAQAPGADIGGTVPSYLSLALDVPAALATFPKTAGVANATVGATITATDAPVTLSIADGDAESAPRHGHLVAATRILPAPLQAAAGGVGFASLEDPLGPLLMRWNDVLAARRTEIRLRQQVSAGALRAGPYSKTVLITVSTQTP